MSVTLAVINDDYVGMYLQKKRKYGAVVSIITTATWSSISVEQDKRSNGTTIIRQHENRNMTRDGAVLYTSREVGRIDTYT